MNKKLLSVLLFSVVLGTLGATSGASAAEIERGDNGRDLPRPMMNGGLRQGMMRNGTGAGGVVAAINGTTLTITSMGRAMSATSALATGTKTFVVDASTAAVFKNGTPTVLSAITLGERVVVEGKVSGQNISATRI